jgi:hypothetical protein
MLSRRRRGSPLAVGKADGTMTMATLSIDRRFCGPPGSGNGGYTAGHLAALIGDSAEVTLRRPPPLETEMRVERAARGCCSCTVPTLSPRGRRRLSSWRFRSVPASMRRAVPVRAIPAWTGTRFQAASSAGRSGQRTDGGLPWAADRWACMGCCLVRGEDHRRGSCRRARLGCDGLSGRLVDQRNRPGCDLCARPDGRAADPPAGRRPCDLAGVVERSCRPEGHRGQCAVHRRW